MLRWKRLDRPIGYQDEYVAELPSGEEIRVYRYDRYPDGPTKSKWYVSGLGNAVGGSTSLAAAKRYALGYVRRTLLHRTLRQLEDLRSVGVEIN